MRPGKNSARKAASRACMVPRSHAPASGFSLSGAAQFDGKSAFIDGKKETDVFRHYLGGQRYLPVPQAVEAELTLVQRRDGFFQRVEQLPRGLGFAIAGTIVTTIGFLLLYQDSTGHWESWAYAWALLTLAAGLGTLIYGLAIGRRVDGRRPFRPR